MELEAPEGFTKSQIDNALLDVQRYKLSPDERTYLEANVRRGNTMTIPRTGWCPTEGDLTLKYHGFPNQYPAPWGK